MQYILDETYCFLSSPISFKPPSFSFPVLVIQTQNLRIISWVRQCILCKRGWCSSDPNSPFQRWRFGAEATIRCTFWMANGADGFSPPSAFSSPHSSLLSDLWERLSGSFAGHLFLLSAFTYVVNCQIPLIIHHGKCPLYFHHNSQSSN